MEGPGKRGRERQPCIENSGLDGESVGREDVMNGDDIQKYSDDVEVFDVVLAPILVQNN